MLKEHTVANTSLFNSLSLSLMPCVSEVQEADSSNDLNDNDIQTCIGNTSVDLYRCIVIRF